MTSWTGRFFVAVASCRSARSLGPGSERVRGKGRRCAARERAAARLVAGGSRVSGGAAPSVPATAHTSERTEPARRIVPVTDVLGVRIGMPEAEAHQRLAGLGVRSDENEEVEHEGSGEALGRELWTLRGSNFRYVLLGVDREGRIASLQAFARPGARKVRYRDLGDLGQARKLGFYIYEWRVPGKGGGRGVRIEARGADPEYLGSYMIVRDRRPTVAGPEAGSEPSGAESDSGR